MAVVRRLPSDTADLRGLRVARWIRESTEDQMEMTGPESQDFDIDGAIERAGLIDTGIGWSVSASGWKKVWMTPEWAQMVEGARRGDFELVVVAPFDRFIRNLKQLLVQLEDVLHPLGVAVYFPEETIISSRVEDWDRLVAHGTDAERWSRTMSTKMRKGHAALRRKGEPGGHAPFGYTRIRPQERRPKVLAEVAADADLVREMYNMAAGGATDREVERVTGRKRTWVAEILTNPFYMGVLSDGSRRTDHLISEELWNQVQVQRGRYARQHPGNGSKRTYPLSGLLFCHSCRRSVTAHCDRYRHVDACDGWRARKPAWSNPRNRGESYVREMFDEVVPTALEKIKVNAELLAETCAAVAALAPQPDHFALTRIEAERRAAATRFIDDRDVRALEATMQRLDDEERAAKDVSTSMPTSEAVVAYLRDLPALYASASVTTQQAIARALFERVEALGPELFWVYPSAEASQQGWAAAMTGTFVSEVQLRAGRGERI